MLLCHTLYMATKSKCSVSIYRIQNLEYETWNMAQKEYCLQSLFTLVLFYPPSCQRYVQHFFTLNKNMYIIFIMYLWLHFRVCHTLYMATKENILLTLIWNIELRVGTLGTWNMEHGIWNIEHSIL
jgi:hypothetical protein